MHNEAEKKRVRTINKIVDDIRDILDVASSFSFIIHRKRRLVTNQIKYQQ